MRIIGNSSRLVAKATAAIAVGFVCAQGAFAQDAEKFDLDALVAAAKTEAPITVYAVTGKIVDTAKAFTKKYGVQATGKKVNEATQADLMIRESQSGKIIGDVSLAMDVGSAMAQLIPEGIVESWVPGDVEADIPEVARNPLVVVSDPQVWTYNTEKYQSCPVKNIWELTEPKWKGKVAMLDLFDKPLYADWFNQLETHHDAEIAKAYEDLYGKKLETDQQSATAAWVKAYAENGPLLADSTAVAEAAGAAGQTEPFMAITATAKYRENVTGGLRLGLCAGIEPFVGFSYPGFGLIAKGTKSPNAAKLFIHYLLTEEGIANQTVDGKVPSSSNIALPADEPSGIARHLGELMLFDSASAADDFDKRQDWQDFWRVNYKK
jgi:iron(III) transport system substrate-binding protein